MIQKCKRKLQNNSQNISYVHCNTLSNVDAKRYTSRNVWPFILILIKDVPVRGRSALPNHHS